jgi:hypothetical protein
MNRVLSPALAVCLIAPAFSLDQAGRAIAPGALQGHRCEVRRVVRQSGTGIEEFRGELVSEVEARYLRFDSGALGLRVPYDRIIAMHYEADTLHARALLSGLTTAHYLTIFYSNSRDQESVATFRLPPRVAGSLVDALESDTGSQIDRTPPRRSFLGLPIRLGLGDTIAVTDNAGKTTTGALTRLSTACVVINGSTASQREFAEPGVRRISRAQPDRRGAPPNAKWWAGIGAAVGGVYGGALNGATGALQGALVFGALWGVIGAGVNAASAAPADFDVYIGPP